MASFSRDTASFAGIVLSVTSLFLAFATKIIRKFF